MAVLTPTRRLRHTQTPADKTPRPHRSPSDLLTVAAICGYVVLLGILAARHEPWFDEAQAWLLARDAGIAELFTRWLPREGSPGLWHVILMGPAKLGMPYQTLNMIAAASAATAAFLLLRRSPFPLPVKLALPFSFFLFYQYAVVARSYVLLPLLLFALAVAYPHKNERAAPYAAFLGLLANATAHGFVIAASLAGLHSLDLLRHRKMMDKRLKRRHLLALCGLALIFALVALQLKSSPHSGFLEKQYRFDLATFGATSSTALKDSMAGRGWITALVVAFSLFWFWRRKTLLVYLVPTTALLTFFSVVYLSPWHEGILTLAWVFAMWLSFESHDGAAPPSPTPSKLDRWARMGALAAVSAVVLVQIGWSLNAFRYDYRLAYSGSKAAAAFIKESGLQGEIIYGSGFASTALLPYFDRNVYANLRGGRQPAFWDWSTRHPLIEDPAKILAARPDLIVLSIKFPDSEKQPALFPGYRVIACFPGALAWKEGPIESDSYLLLAPASRTHFPREPHPASQCPPSGSEK